MKKRSVSEFVYSKLREMIENGTIAVGQKLPTEQALCEQFGVGRSSVREASRILQAKGFVEIKRGSGVYVISKTEYAPENMSKWLLDNKESILNYMHVRMAIEDLAITLFIQQQDKKQVKALQQIEKNFEAAVEEGNTYRMVAMDEAFHGAIARGTKNSLLISITKQLEDTFNKYRNITFSNAEHRKAAVDGHRRILDSICNRDTNSAKYNMRDHLQISVQNAINMAGF